MSLRLRKVFTLFLLQFILIEALRNVVVINNKPMTYDSRGELVELSIYSDSKNEEINEKSNIFKKSDFVTKSKFTHNGILTKHNFTRREPPKNSKFTYDISNDFPNYSLINSLFNKEPGYIQTAVVFDDVKNPQIDDNLTYDIFQPPQKFERPTVAFYTTTPAPTSIIPIIVTQQPSNNNKKSNKKTKTKKTPLKPVTSDIHDHIMKNLDYYKKLLSINCTSKGQNESKNEESETIEITPRPINDKDIKSDKKDKNKKKCDCKHHHGHHHGHDHHHHGHHKHSHEKHSHEKHSHENYKPAVILHQPSSIQPVYVQSHKLPEYQTHIHHHQSSKGNKGIGIGVADNAAFFESTGKFQSLS